LAQGRRGWSIHVPIDAEGELRQSAPKCHARLLPAGPPPEPVVRQGRTRPTAICPTVGAASAAGRSHPSQYRTRRCCRRHRWHRFPSRSPRVPVEIAGNCSRHM
jgi:hypothetical protein